MKSFSFSPVRRAVAPLFVLVAGGLLMAPAMAATNLIVNGSFETGDFTGWTTTRPSGDFSAAIDSYRTSEGNYAVRFNLGNVPASAVLSQQIPTIIGKTYRVAFDFYTEGPTKTQSVRVDFTGNNPQTANITSYGIGQPFVTYTYDFVATATTSTVSFTDVTADGESQDSFFDNVQVSLLNTAPVALNPTGSTDEDVALSANLGAIDADNNTLTYSKVSDPAFGSVTVNSDGTYTYTPNANFNGIDSFTFKANDGIVDSNVGTVIITVNPINDAPIVSDQNVNLDEDNTKTITISASDVDGDDLVFNVVSGPTHGTLDKTSGALVNGSLDVTYTPDANYNGPDTFQYTISDKGGIYFSGTGHYYEYVAAPDISWDAAQAAASSKKLFGQTGYLATITSAEENQFVSGKLQGQGWLGGSDEAQEDVWRWVTGPEATEDNGQGRHFWTGKANGIPAAGQYANWNGGEPNGHETDEDYLMTIGTGANVPWNDYPKSAYNPGALHLINGYVIEYGGLTGETVSAPTANVNIFVDPVNDKPIGTPKSITMKQGTTYNGNVKATDVEGDALSYNLDNPPANGNITFFPDGSFIYTPDAGFVGSDSFTFTATDSGVGPAVAGAGPGLTSDPVTVSITVKDATKPAVAISSPTTNTKVMINAFTGDVVSGVAIDNVEVTAVKVRLSRKRGTANQYWNGTSWVAGQAWLSATIQPINPDSVAVSTLPTRQIKWTLDGQLPSEGLLDSGTYALQVYAQDAVGNKSAYDNSTFTIQKDVTAPTLSISTPTLSQKVLIEAFDGFAVSGQASDDSAIASVKVRLSRKRGTTNQYWNGADFVTTPSTVDATYAEGGWHLGANTPEADKLDNGAYQVEAFAIDAAGNKSTTSKVTFSLSSDFSAPSVAISSPTSSKVIKINEFGAGKITGTAGDNKGITSVKLKLQRKRSMGFEYWNGTSFSSAVATVDASYDSQSGTWSYDTAIPGWALDAGGYTLYATASDAAGNKTTSAARIFNIVGSATAADAPVVADKSAGSS